MNKTRSFVGLDIGTSGVRAVAIDEAGTELATAASPLPPPARDADGGSEQDPEVWWVSVVGVLRRLGEMLPGGEMGCLAVDGTSGTLLLCGPEGRPLSPALMYDDGRSHPALPRIHAIAPPSAPVHSASSSLAKLVHLIDGLGLGDRPGVRALHQADWILGRLAGHFGVSDENNCLKLGYDAANRCWPDWVRAFGFPEDLLPVVHPAGTIIGRIGSEAASLIGWSRGCLVATGTTDSTAAAIASGIREPGEAVSSLGSTLAIKVLATEPLFERAYGIYSHRLGDAWLVGGASNSGGAVLAHFFAPERLVALSAHIDPESPTGLNYYPLLRPGERFPVADPEMPPRLSPRPPSEARFLQGLLEGITDIERRGYRRLAELGSPYPTRVVSIGGGASNETWRRLRARALGVPVLRAVHQQAAYGTALLARRAFLGTDRWP